MHHMSLLGSNKPFTADWPPSRSARCPSEPKKIRPALRSKASSLKATCALSRLRADSELVVLAAVDVALSMPAQAVMLESDIIRYRNLDSGVILEGTGSSELLSVSAVFSYVSDCSWTNCAS